MIGKSAPIKKAVLIGVRYLSKPDEELHLDSCHKDVEEMYCFLLLHGYSQENIRMFTDKEACDTCMRHVECKGKRCPNRKNIIEAMYWLVENATPNHQLIFYFAGHGHQVPDTNGDEDDQLDEAIVPSDCRLTVVGVKKPLQDDRNVKKTTIQIEIENANVIIDDDMKSIMVDNLPEGCHITAIYDSCHSGTALDLPHVYNATMVEGACVAAHQQALVSASAIRPSHTRASCSSTRSVGTPLHVTIRQVLPSRVGGNLLSPVERGSVSAIQLQGDPIKATAISLGACADDGFSADDRTSLAKAFINAIKTHGESLTYGHLLLSINAAIQDDTIKQKPTMCLSHRVDWDAPAKLI